MVDNCSPGRGGIAQDGGIRGGTFDCEMDHCRESQSWTSACSSIPECDGKDQGEDSPKQAARAGSSAIVDKPQVAQTCILRAFFGLPMLYRIAFIWLSLCFVFVVLLTTLNPRPLVQSFFDMHPPRKPHAVS